MPPRYMPDGADFDHSYTQKFMGMPAQQARAKGGMSSAAPDLNMPGARAPQNVAKMLGARAAMSGLGNVARRRGAVPPMSDAPAAMSSLAAAPPPPIRGAIPAPAGSRVAGGVPAMKKGGVPAFNSKRMGDDERSEKTKDNERAEKHFADGGGAGSSHRSETYKSRDKDAPDGFAKGGFIKGAIKHPGRMTNAAKRAGESTHDYMESHKDSPGSLGAAARFGLRLTGGDLSPKKVMKKADGGAVNRRAPIDLSPKEIEAMESGADNAERRDRQDYRGRLHRDITSTYPDVAAQSVARKKYNQPDMGVSDDSRVGDIGVVFSSRAKSKQDTETPGYAKGGKVKRFATGGMVKSPGQVNANLPPNQRPPVNPMQTRTPDNITPGGVIAYGVQPSMERSPGDSQMYGNALKKRGR